MEIEQHLSHFSRETSPSIKGTQGGSLSFIRRSFGSLGTFSFLNFMQSPAPNADDDRSVGGEVAMDEGKGPEARYVLISQPSKVSTCPAMRIKPIADHQMTSAPNR